MVIWFSLRGVATGQRIVWWTKKERNVLTHICRINTDGLRSYKKEDVGWLPMRHLYTRDQMIQKLTTIGHRMAFNNEHSP